MNALIPIADIQTMAEVAAKSRMFGFKSTEEAMAIMLLCQAESLHPAIAMRDYHVIQGRPTLKADAMLARFQQAGGKVQWDQYTDDEVSATFSHPNGGSLSVSWTFKQAQEIGLTGKDNWKKYPRAMLRARVISEGIRTVYPGCVVGVYTPEEASDFDNKHRPERDITPSEPPIDGSGTVDIVDAENVAEGVETVSVSVVESWPLAIPGKDSVEFGSKEEWVAGLYQLCEKLGSSKLTIAVKNVKIEMLKKANVNAFRRIGLSDSAEIYRNMDKSVKGGEGDASEVKKQTQEWASQFQEEMDKPAQS
jgi:hypothetical protein